jgi:outer membrane protein OmpU
MKKILLATTMLVGGASIAAAEVSVSGTARMGVISNFSDGVVTNGDESELSFSSRVRVIFTLSGETDSGLSFGASIRADNAAAGNQGDAGEVFVSGAFGKLSMGDVDGAAQMATGHVGGVGYTGLSDLNESVFLGAGTGATDPTALYEYSAGDFTFYLSAANPRPVVTAGGTSVTADLTAIAIGAKYTFGDYTVGLGYENLQGYTGAAVALPTADNTDVDHIVLKLSANVAGFNVQGLIGQADGTLGGAVLDNAKQYAMSVGYTVDAISGTVFYTDDSDLGGTTAYGLGASYDLGGGAALVGGISKDHDANESAYDLGITMSF